MLMGHQTRQNRVQTISLIAAASMHHHHRAQQPCVCTHHYTFTSAVHSLKSQLWMGVCLSCFEALIARSDYSLM